MTPMNRRQFVGRTIAGAGALAVAPQLLRAEPAAGKPGAPAAAPTDGRKRASDRIALGKTGLRVSRVGMGSGTVGWNHESNQTRLGIDGFEKLIRHGWERGLNFFDAADMYGSHAYFRKALEKLPREEYVVSTKISWRGVNKPAAAIDRFRLELGIDVLDIVLVHCVTDGDWAGAGEGKKGLERKTLDAILEAKAKGIVRAVGVSAHGLAPLKTAAETPGIDYHLVRINPAGEKMDGSPDEVVPVLRRMHDQGRAVCGMKIVGEGALRDRIDESLKFVLGLGCVDTMTVGFESAEQIDDFIGRMERALNG